jgi:hypothetical protein
MLILDYVIYRIVAIILNMLMATVRCLGKTLAKNNKNWIKIILFSVKLIIDSRVYYSFYCHCSDTNLAY